MDFLIVLVELISHTTTEKGLTIQIRLDTNTYNNCHWIADIIFKEDTVQMDVRHSAENLSMFCRLAMNRADLAIQDLASVRRAAKFGVGYLKGVLGKIFLRKNVKTF